MATILITGAGGMLGHKLCQLLSATGHQVTGTVRGEASQFTVYTQVYRNTELIGGIDAIKLGQIEDVINVLRPDWIINCIGIVKQRPEAHDRFLSVAINSYLPHRLAQASAAIGCRLLHISTDCVFSGTRGSYRESDPSDADDIYGKSKYLGETDATESCAITLRTSIIGRELTAPKTGLLEWFLAKQGRMVRGFSKAIFSGLTTAALAKLINQLVERGGAPSGLYNIASEPISKYNLLLLLREQFAMDVQIVCDDSVVCDRSLVMGRFTEATGYAVPSWETMLRELRADETSYG